MSKEYTIEVKGDMALFTRPEFKVERMSYEVITPSACRAIFEAIYWKPQMMWRIKQIEVIKPIAFTHFMRCETAAMANVYKREIVAEKCRQLRSSVVLRDVEYRIRGELISLDGNEAKHCAMFERRASKGQCFTQPYLGCREFSAHWRLVGGDDELPPPIALSKELGMMLKDMDFSDPDRPQPQFFRAEIINGTIKI